MIKILVPPVPCQICINNKSYKLTGIIGYCCTSHRTVGVLWLEQTYIEVKMFDRLVIPAVFGQSAYEVPTFYHRCVSQILTTCPSAEELLSFLTYALDNWEEASREIKVNHFRFLQETE